MIRQDHPLESFNFNSNDNHHENQTTLHRYSSRQFNTIQYLSNDPSPNQQLNQKCRKSTLSKVKSKQRIIFNPSSQQPLNSVKDRFQQKEGMNSISELVIPQHKKYAIQQNQQDFMMPQHSKVRKGSYNEPKTHFISTKNKSFGNIQKQTISKFRDYASNHLYKKYSPDFLFFMGKPINLVVYNQQSELPCIDFKDISCFSEQCEYLKRFYQYRTTTNRNEIMDKLVQLINIYGKKQIMMNSMSATFSSTMIVTETKSIFIRRHKRRQRLFLNWSNEQSQQASKQKSKISARNFKKSHNDKQWGSLSFLNGSISSFYQRGCKLQFKMSKNTRCEQTKGIIDNLEFSSSYNIYKDEEESIQANEQCAQHENLKQLLQSLLPNNMFKITSSSQYLQVNHLVHDFNDIDEQITMKNYRELEKRKKNKKQLIVNKNSGIMQVSGIQGTVNNNYLSQQIGQISIFQRKSIRLGTSQSKQDLNSGDQTPRFIAMNSKVYHKKTSSSEIIQRKSIKKEIQHEENNQTKHVDIKQMDYLQQPNNLLNKITRLLQSNIQDPSIIINGSQRLDESGEIKTLHFSQQKNDMKIALQTTKKLQEIISQNNKKMIGQTLRKRQKFDLMIETQNLLAVATSPKQMKSYSNNKRQRYDSFEELFQREVYTEKFPHSSVQQKNDFVNRNKKQKERGNKKKIQVQMIDNMRKKEEEQFNVSSHRKQELNMINQPQGRSRQKRNPEQLTKVKSQTYFRNQPLEKQKSNREQFNVYLEKKESLKINRQTTNVEERELQRVHSTKLLGAHQNYNSNESSMTPKYQQKRHGINSNLDQVVKIKELKIKNLQHKGDNFTMMKKEQIPKPNKSNKLYQQYLKKKQQNNLQLHKSPSRNIIFQNIQIIQPPNSPKNYVPKTYLTEKDKTDAIHRIQFEKIELKQPGAKTGNFSKYSKKFQFEEPNFLQQQDHNKEKKKYFYGNPKTENTNDVGFTKSKYNQSQKINYPVNYDYKNKVNSNGNLVYEEWKNNKYKDRQTKFQTVEEEVFRPIVKTLTYNSSKTNLSNNNFKSPPKDKELGNESPSNWSPPLNQNGTDYQRSKYARNIQKYSAKNQTYK